jgi:hypothetical protein
VCAFPSKLILLKMYVDVSSCSWRVVFSTNIFLLQWFGFRSFRIHIVQFWIRFKILNVFTQSCVQK